MNQLSSPIECVEADHIILNRDFLDTLKDLDLNTFEKVWQFRGGETIKKIKARSVIRIKVQHHDGQRYFFLKRHNREFVGFRRLVSLLFPSRIVSQGRREFQNICDFRKSGLATVSSVAAGERYRRFFWVESFFITEDFFPYISLEYIVINQPEFFKGSECTLRRRALIEEVAFLARRMHSSGLNHLDFNATHILMHYEKGVDTPGIALFDLQRVNRRKFFRFRWMIKSLARVNFTLPDELFSEAERIHLLLDYKRKEKMNVFDRFQWFYIKKKTSRIKRHTKKNMSKREAKKAAGQIER